MKMKDVIEKTGLTDRAVRLYIDEGLAVPNIEESYSGRKSIDFSESDVERLKNVALLRKAGFSIADIKSIVDDSSTAKNIVENFIEQTENNIAHETEIVEKLKGISFDEDVTLETICNSLSETVEEKEVPSEDIKLTPKEKITKFLFITFASLQIVVSVHALILICLSTFNYRYPCISENGISVLLFHIGWFVTILLCAVIIRLNTGRYVSVKSRKTLKRLSAILTFVTMLCGLASNFFSLIGVFAQPVYSQTDNPDNYLVFDKWSKDELEQICDFFPGVIPDSAINCTKSLHEADYPYTTKYFYRYTCDNDYWYESYDVCAEWSLPDEEYRKAKNELPKGTNTVQRGNWTCIYYERRVSFIEDRKDLLDEYTGTDEIDYKNFKDEFVIKNWGRIGYSFSVAAYNDQTQRIRYIVSGCCGHNHSSAGPYYLSLDW
ncbi:MAG: MerR family transcriptional regulator [Clostridia bacterium]|nr:MerR family transcriptional regulator [Clostridia bacterium]